MPPLPLYYSNVSFTYTFILSLTLFTNVPFSNIEISPENYFNFCLQNKEKKDTIGDSNKRPFVRVDRDKDLEKEAKKLQVTKTASAAVAAAIANTPVPAVLPSPLPPW